MGETARAKVLPDRLADPLVLAEHHAAQQRGVVRRHPGADRPLRARASTIEQTGHPSAPGARDACVLEHELAGDAAPSQIGGEVKAAGLVTGTPSESRQSTLERQLRPGLDCGRQRCPARDPQQQPRTAQAAAHHRDLGGGAERTGARSGEQVGANLDGLSVTHPSGRAVDRLDPEFADRGTREHQRGGDRAEPWRPEPRRPPSPPSRSAPTTTMAATPPAAAMTNSGRASASASPSATAAIATWNGRSPGEGKPARVTAGAPGLLWRVPSSISRLHRFAQALEALFADPLDLA